MTTQITLKIKDIKAVAHAMAVKDIRTYLNGMLIEHNGSETRLVATNGHSLHGVIVYHKDALVETPQQFIVPDTLIKIIIKAKVPKHDNRHEVTLSFDAGKVVASLPDGTESIAKLVDGKFPDYIRVIPSSASGEYPDDGMINPKYLADAMQGAADYLEIKHCPIGPKYNGKSAAVLCARDFVSVMMPMLGTQSENPVAAWNRDIEAPSPESVPLPDEFSHLQGAVDYANRQSNAAVAAEGN